VTGVQTCALPICTSTGTLAWVPLTRDGGARLSRFYQLYDLTGASDTNRFNAGFDGILK